MMNKNIVIQNSYSINPKEKKNGYVVTEKYQVESLYRRVKRDIPGIGISRSLSGDVDVFTELPVAIYKEKNVALFLNALRDAILEENPQNVTLSKLIVSEKTDTGCTLDWMNIMGHFAAANRS